MVVSSRCCAACASKQPDTFSRQQTNLFNLHFVRIFFLFLDFCAQQQISICIYLFANKKKKTFLLFMRFFSGPSFGIRNLF
jgi:hypothetical protein